MRWWASKPVPHRIIGRGAQGARPHGKADASGLREALRQTAEE